MAWYIKTSLFYYQNTCDFKPLSTTLQGCLYIVVRLMAVFPTLHIWRMVCLESESPIQQEQCLSQI
ncbi:hypothetical protein EC547_04455 [Helicobacter pylori]|uniref:Uncharacterized protein n=1 Tax=Helicobacter pylori TaxID=210 RepID=A0AB37UZL4_HELPX|nr:hypothetical protein EC547_04455 [Helicobacter pylori]